MRRRIGLGVLLILVGVGLLLLYISGYHWDWAELWPLLFVLLGLLEIFEHGWRSIRGAGGFMFLLGCLLLLFTMGLVPWSIRQVWPAGLILFGLLSLFGEDPSLSWAIILVGGGCFLLALTTGRLPGDWRHFWPVILILAGLVALVGGEGRSRREPRVPPASQPASTAPPASETERLAVLARIRAGEISVEEGAAILEGLKEPRPGKRR